MITFVFAVNDWRAKWNLSSQYADASFDDIIRDMADIQPHVRLKAIATVGKAAEYKRPSLPDIQLEGKAAYGDPLDVRWTGKPVKSGNILETGTYYRV
jgi:hypothetical protein